VSKDDKYRSISVEELQAFYDDHPAANVTKAVVAQRIEELMRWLDGAYRRMVEPAKAPELYSEVLRMLTNAMAYVAAQSYVNGSEGRVTPKPEESEEGPCPN